MYLYTYISAHTAVVKNVIGFGFDFDFMFDVTTRQARTKLKTITLQKNKGETTQQGAPRSFCDTTGYLSKIRVQF